MTRAKISEAEFTAQVVTFARLHGWKVAHFRAVKVQRGNGSTYHATPTQGDAKGWPDLILVHPGRGEIIAAELKVKGGRASPEQEAWLEALRATGMAAGYWYPEDWASIEKTLGAV